MVTELNSLTAPIVESTVGQTPRALWEERDSSPENPMPEKGWICWAAADYEELLETWRRGYEGKVDSWQRGVDCELGR